MTPQSFLSPGENSEVAGGTPDSTAILRDAIRNGRCAECGSELPGYVVRNAHTESGLIRRAFCSEKHFYAFRDRRRYAENADAQRARSRAYYWRNREVVLEKAAAKRGRPRPPEHTHCTECGDELTGRQRVICGKASCRERRFRRTNPEAYAERERQKVVRRREARLAKREGGAT